MDEESLGLGDHLNYLLWAFVCLPFLPPESKGVGFDSSISVVFPWKCWLEHKSIES